MNRPAETPAVSGSVLYGNAFRIAIFAIVAILGLASVTLHAESANAFFKHGESAEAREDYDAAFENYKKAYAKAPTDLRFRAAFYRVRVSASSLHMKNGRNLLLAGNMPGALVEFLRASEIDPGNEAAQQEIARVRKKQGEITPAGETSLTAVAGKQDDIDSMDSPATLKPVSNEPLTLHISEDAKVVYQAVGRAAGVNVLFDPDFNSKRIQVDLNNVSLLDALRIVGTMSNTFWRPVTSNTLFVAQNTRAKRTELEEQAVQTFYLTNAWQQNDLNDVQTALRNVLPTAKVYGVASQNAIVMRGTPDELLLAQKLIDDLDKARAEVVVDVAILEVSKNWEKNLGLTWPSSAKVALQTDIDSTSSSSTTTTTATKDEATLYNLAHLKSSDFLVTIGEATANMLLTDSNTKILQNPRIRCTDAQKAIMKIGKRIPIATGSYSTGTSSNLASSLVNTQFQYLDVGVNIEMTPTIHYDHDVTLKIKLEVSSQDGQSTISGVTEPIIAQKTSEQVIRLREGEASVMSGVLNKQDTVAWTGIPGLSAIPGLKYLFGSKDHTVTDDEIVFLLIPHIVRTQELSSVNLRTIDTGTGQSIELRHVPADVPTAKPAANPASAPAAPVRSINPARSSVGVIPSESAMNAAPAALAQMRAAATSDGSTTADSRPTNQPIAPVAKSASFSLNPPAGPVAVGTTFQIPVVLMGAKDVVSVPLQLQYDPAKISLVNVDTGDLLGRDGQAVALVHRDDGPGSLTVNASRPPGAVGVNGAGVVCVLSFQAKAAGDSNLVITRPGALNSAQQQVSATGATVNIVVK
jgi:general secretion pathway protein D